MSLDFHVIKKRLKAKDIILPNVEQLLNPQLRYFVCYHFFGINFYVDISPIYNITNHFWSLYKNENDKMLLILPDTACVSTGAWHPPKFWRSPLAPLDFEVFITNWHPQSSFYVKRGTLSTKFLTQDLTEIVLVFLEG